MTSKGHPAVSRFSSTVLTALLATAGVTVGSTAQAGGQGPYEITKTEPKLTQGGRATASLTITAKDGWHVNPSAPITLSVSAGDGVTTGKVKQGRTDLVQSTNEVARFDIPLEASQSGQKTLSAEAKFVLCQASACKPVKDTVTFNLLVVPAAKK